MSIWKRISGLSSSDSAESLQKTAKSGSIGAFFRDLVGGFAAPHDDDCDGPQCDVAFTMGVIALCAKMAAADGVVTRDEVEAFKQVFKVPEGEAANVRRVFNLAKQDVAGFEAYAQQISGLLRNDPELLQDVLEGLFHIAAADGILHPAEEDYLKAVAGIFNIDDKAFRVIRAYFVTDVDGPYEVLGVTADISDKDLKVRHRELVIKNHPDKLIARGVPAEFVEVANRKLAAINEAYDAIVKERAS